MRSKDVTDAQYSDLLSAAGCKNMACLRALPEIKLYNATMDSYAISYKKGLYGYGDFWYTPTKDGTIIKDYFSQSFAKGAFTSVPLITTRQTYEGKKNINLSINQRLIMPTHARPRFHQLLRQHGCGRQVQPATTLPHDRFEIHRSSAGDLSNRAIHVMAHRPGLCYLPNHSPVHKDQHILLSVTRHLEQLCHHLPILLWRSRECQERRSHMETILRCW